MAKDVAQRDLDQAGFRISNLGDPDHRRRRHQDRQHDRARRPASGTGSPGTSLLAAPADHVHPAAAVVERLLLHAHATRASRSSRARTRP